MLLKLPNSLHMTIFSLEHNQLWMPIQYLNKIVNLLFAQNMCGHSLYYEKKADYSYTAVWKIGALDFLSAKQLSLFWFGFIVSNKAK